MGLFENKANCFKPFLIFAKGPILDWVGLNWDALFRVDKIIEKKNHMHKMHNTSSSPYQSICLIKVNVNNNNNNNNNNNSNNNNDNNNSINNNSNNT